VFRHPVWLPPSFPKGSSPHRLAEGMQWDRDTLWPKYNLSERIPLAEVQGTMKPYDYQVLLWMGKEEKGSAPSLLTYLILPGEPSIPGMGRIGLEETEAEGLDDISLWHNPDPLPRAWIVHQVDVLPPLASSDPHVVSRRTREVFYPDGRPRDLRASAVVEGKRGREGGQSPLLSPRAKKLPRAATTNEAQVPCRCSCRVVRYDPSCVEIEAELNEPGLVVLCDQFYPGWRLDVQTAGQGTRQIPILRANRVMRGAWLPAGRHRLSYRYRPATVFWGACLSGIGWLALTAIALATAAHHRRVGASARL
jgi:hypothetical protein